MKPTKTLPRRDFLLWGAGVATTALCVTETVVAAPLSRSDRKNGSPSVIFFAESGISTSDSSEIAAPLSASGFVRLRVSGQVPANLPVPRLTLSVRYAAADVLMWSAETTVTNGGEPIANVSGGATVRVPLDKTGNVVLPFAHNETGDITELRFGSNAPPLLRGTYVVAVAQNRRAPDLSRFVWNPEQARLIGKTEPTFPYVAITLSDADAPTDTDISEEKG